MLKTNTNRLLGSEGPFGLFRTASNARMPECQNARKWEEELECMEKIIAWLEEGKDRSRYIPVDTSTLVKNVRALHFKPLDLRMHWRM